MNSSSEQVLRGPAAQSVVTARLDLDVRSASALLPGWVDPRSVDPRLHGAFNTALDDIRDRATDEGFAAGYTAGQEQAAVQARAAEIQRIEDTRLLHEQLRQSAEKIMDSLTAAVDECTTRDAASVEELQEVAIETALRLAHELLGREVALGAAATADTLRVAMRLLAHDDDMVVVRVAPTESAEVENLLAGQGLTPRVVPDPAIRPGGGLLECGATRLDARLDAALDRVREALAR